MPFFPASLIDLPQTFANSVEREEKKGGWEAQQLIFTSYFLPVPWKPNSKATDVQMFENIWIPAGLAAGLHQLQSAKFYKYCQKAGHK